MTPTRNVVIVRLKNELDAAIELVSQARETLSLEMSGSVRVWKTQGVESAFLKKLQQLTASFNSLTESKMRLDKAEKQMEADMTPGEEAEAVLAYLRDLPDLAKFLKRL